MGGQRKALIVANDVYDQDALQNLIAPAADAEALGQVLGDQQIGDFTVQVVRNEPSYVIQAQIEELFLESAPDDVLLLHFSGHGIKNQSGELFFAAANTRPNRLGSTAVSADFVQRCMKAARSRSIVLLLDCCYGGAFASGVAVRASGDVNVLDSFPQERAGGRGRAVITASNAMEYAFEGDQLADSQRARPSVFTAALVAGLATGDADRDEDGWVSLNELYDYVFEKVREQNPHQTPSRAVEMEGELYVARSRRQRIHPIPLPPDLQAAVTDPNMYSRLGAVSELRSRLNSDNLPTAAGAYEALAELARTDIRFVADPAADALSQATPHPEEMELHFGEWRQGAEPPHRVVRLLGPPIARACVPHLSHDWIRVNEVAGGLDISVDTNRTGSLRGSLDLKGPTGEAVIAIDVDLVPPMQQIPTATRPGMGASQGTRAPASPASLPEAQLAPPPAAPPTVHGAETNPVGKTARTEPAPGWALWTAERKPQGGEQPRQSVASAPSVPHYPQPRMLQASQKVCAVAFSPDGSRLAAGSRGSIRVWNLQTLAHAWELPIGNRDTAKALVFSPDGTRLAGISGPTARIWDYTNGQQQLEVAHDGISVLAVAFSPDGTRLATGDCYQNVRVWDATTGQEMAVTHDGAALQPVGGMAVPLAAVRDRVSVISLSPDGTRLASGKRGSVRIWDLQMRAQVWELPIGNLDAVEALVFSPDGSRLAAAGGQIARIWDSTTKRQLEVTHDPSSVLAVAFSPDGTRLATGDSYQSARIWDATTGRLELEVTHNGSSVLAVAFSPDGTRLATGSGDKTARIWDIAN